MQHDVLARQDSALLVLWQQPSTRAMIPIGELSFDGQQYTFNYLPAAEQLPGFRPLLGFKDFAKTYTSDELFPLFHERVLDPARSDFDQMLHELDLDLATATPWELLVRTGGGSEGDTLQVTPLPKPEGSGWSCTFLASGVRYFREKSVQTARGFTQIHSDGSFEDVLSSLRPGDPLSVEREVGNDYNPHARVLLTQADHPVGYMPDWLARFTAPFFDDGTEVQADVLRVNEPDAGWHLRLLVHMTASESFESANTRLRDGAALNYGVDASQA